MAKAKKAKRNPVLTVFCAIAVILFGIAAGVLTFDLLQKGILPTAMLRLLVIGFSVVAVISLALFLTRSTALRVITMLILLILVGVMVYGVFVLKDVDKTLANMTTDTSTKTTPVVIIAMNDSGISSTANLAGGNVGCAGLTPAQYEAITGHINGAAANVNYVQFGSPAESIAALRTGEVNAIVLLEAIYDVFANPDDGVMPELANTTVKLDTVSVTEAYTTVIDNGVNDVEEEFPELENSEVSEADAAAAVQQAAADAEAEAAALAAAEAAAAEAAQAAAEAAQNAAIPAYQRAGLPRSMMFYVSGIDTTGTIDTVSRSDVNVLVAVNFETHEVAMVQTPRDYYLPISVSSSGMRDKLTHCGIYGVQCSIDTLSAAYDVEVDHFFQVNFSGFIKIVDAIGGITVYNEKYWVNGAGVFEEGELHLDGYHALAFARNRKQVGIVARGNHHMQVIEAVVNQVISHPEIMLNYAEIMQSVEGFFATDLTPEEIYKIISMQLDDPRGWTFTSYSVYGTPSSTTKSYSMYTTEVYIILPFAQDLQQGHDMLMDVYNATLDSRSAEQAAVATVELNDLGGSGGEEDAA